jgi:hypothetical protein
VKNLSLNKNSFLCGDKLKNSNFESLSKKYENFSNFDVIKSSCKKYQASDKSENNNTNNLIIKNSNNNKVSGKMVAAGDLINEEQINQFDGNESSEELKYGPGIVSKLRCRYLSLTLRQAAAKQRPSINNLRRTTSLNNLLDDEDEDETEIDHKVEEEKNEPHIIENYVKTVRETYQNGRQENGHHNQRNSRSNEKASDMRQKNRHDSMKRARSVEAILRYDNNAWERDVQKENIVNRLSHQEYIGFKNREVTIEDKIINARERNDPKPKRLTSLIGDDERPPPHVVKQTMLIFESNANKKRNSITRPIGSEVAAKVATFKTIISQEKPAVVFPKPSVQAKKPNIIPRTTSPKPIISNMKNNSVNISNNCAKFVKEKPVLPKLDINIIKNNLETKSNGVASNGNVNVMSPTNGKSNLNSDYRNNKDFSGSDSSASTPNILSPFRNSMTPSPQFEANKKPTVTTTDSPMSLLTNKLSNIHVNETPKNLKNNVKEMEKEMEKETKPLEQSESENDDFEDDSSDSSEIKIKRISSTALENISKAGTTQLFKFSNNNSNNLISNNLSNECNNRALPVPNNCENSVSEPSLVAPEKPVKEKISEEVMSEVIVKPVREIKAPSVPPPLPPIASARSVLTTREIEKNSINKEKDDAPIVPPRDMKNIGAVGGPTTASSSSSTSNATNNSNGAESAPKWAVKKKSRSQEPENNSMVFNFSDRKDVPDYIEHDGLILRRKRELPKVSVDFLFG